MAISKLTEDLNIIQALDDEPNDTGGLSSAQLKAKFDEAAGKIKAFLNNTLTAELEALLNGKMAAPAQEGATGQYLKTDGAGGRSWDTPSGSGDMLQSVYDADADGTVDAADTAAACTGNAATADRLKTARTFTVKDADETNAGAAVSFDGSGNIVVKLPAAIKAVLTGNVAGNVNGNAATASKLQTPRSIGGASFDGSANVTLAQIGALPASGALVLTSAVYGNALPAAGTAGRIFFKKV